MLTMEEVYAQYYLRLRRLAARYVGFEDAEDVVQNVMCILLRKLGDYDGSFKLITWLGRITVNEAIAILRIRRRDKKAILVAKQAGYTVNYYAQLECDELKRRIDSITLTALERNALELMLGGIRDIKGSQKLRSRLFLARNKLRAAL